MELAFETIKVTILPDGRMNATEAAKYLGLAKKTLDMHRVNGTGPKFLKKGRIFYYREDLDAWLKS